MKKPVLIQNAEIFSPEPLGRADILVLGNQISKIGKIDAKVLSQLHLDVEVIDAENAVVIPGIIDAHQHFIGGSGERGYATRTPEITLGEIISGGITTAVGCIGVDTSTRTMPELLARAKMFNEEGFNAFIYSGGYDIPPKTLTGNIRTDMIYIPEVIGCGEIAIADRRSSHPSLPDLAKAVGDAYIGGLLTKKAGVSHIHVGPGRERMASLRALLEQFEISPACLHPTHMGRSSALMDEGIEFTKLGITIDLDTEEDDVEKWLTYFLEHGGNLNFLTLSSDASISAPASLFAQFRNFVLKHKRPLNEFLPLITVNPARVLGLHQKGKIAEGFDADITILHRDDLRVRDVIVNGKVFMRNEKVTFVPKYLAHTNRSIELHGQNQNRLK